jgi:hypothetical protein
LTAAERAAIAALGSDVERVWSAATTTDRDRKELRTLLEEVIITVDRQAGHAELTLRWRGGAITELTVDRPRSQPPKIRTSEDTIALIGRLAAHYPDQIIAGILNRQGRRSARGQRFTASIVQGLRHHWKIGCYQPPATPPGGELVTITQAAKILGVVPSTVHRWLADGFIAGEQPTPGAPWRIQMTDQLCGRFVEQAPQGWLPMLEATMALGVSRQTVLQRVKRGELRAVHVRTGRRKGLRIEVPKADGGLLDTLASTKGQCDAGSKQSRTSASSTQSAARLASALMASHAWWAERRGRNPKLTGRKSASNIGSRTSFAAVIATRSRTVGMPSGRVLPGWPGLGMWTRRSGAGR